MVSRCVRLRKHLRQQCPVQPRLPSLAKRKVLIPVLYVMMRSLTILTLKEDRTASSVMGLAPRGYITESRMRWCVQAIV